MKLCFSRFPVFLLVLISFLGLAGCGGGTETDSPASISGADSNPIVRGVAVKGALRNATVNLFDIDAAGVPLGTPLRSVQTDSNGGFNFDLTGLTGPFLLQTSGGQFLDEADPDLRRQIIFSVGQGLQAILLDGQSTVAITPLADALYRKSVNEAGGSRFLEFFLANVDSATDAYGFNIATTLPENPVNPSPSAAEASRRYALALGGAAHVINAYAIRSGLAEPNAETLELFIQDLSDGQLDGAFGGDPLTIQVDGDTRQLPTDEDLSASARRFRNNFSNFYRNTNEFVLDETILSQVPVIVDQNQVPSAFDDSFSIDEDSLLTGNLLADNGNGADVDPDGDSLTVISVNGQAVDSSVIVPVGDTQLEVSANGDISFDPIGFFDFLRSDDQENFEFSYQISDGNGGQAGADFFLEIQGVNDAPIVGTNNPLTVFTGSIVPITTSTLSALDLDNAPGDLRFQLQAQTPTCGDFLVGGVAVNSFSQLELLGDQVSFLESNCFAPAGQFQLLDGSFESIENIFTDFPTSANGWSGDPADIVGAENGITPLDEFQMLSFNATGIEGATQFSSADVIQLVDLSGLQAEFNGNREIGLILKAFFNRVDVDEDTDTRFGVRLEFYQGALSDFPSKALAGDFILRVNDSLESDADTATWEPLSVSSEIPAGADYVAVRVEANENIVNDSVAPEFDGHYVDLVTLQGFVTRERLPFVLTDGQATTEPFDLVMNISPNLGVCTAPQDGLRAWYQGEGNALDRAGFNNGVLQNGVEFSSAFVGNGFRLDGVDDFVDIPTQDFSAATSMTVDAWVRVESKDDGTVEHAIFARRDPGAREGFMLTIDSQFNLLRIQLGTESETSGFRFSQFQTVSDSIPADGSFVHVAASYDESSGQVRAFINGAEQLVELTAGELPIGPLAATNESFIGQRQVVVIPSEGVAGLSRLKGNVDEVHVYDRALNATQIQAIFAAGGAGLCVEELGNLDNDGDGLTAVQEANFGTSDNNADSDGDGFSDFDEVNQDGNPNNFDPNAGDSNPNDINDTPNTEPQVQTQVLQLSSRGATRLDTALQVIDPDTPADQISIDLETQGFCGRSLVGGVENNQFNRDQLVSGRVVVADPACTSPEGFNGLINASFETTETVGGTAPNRVGDWSNDQGTIIGAENGIEPLEGQQMLRFDSTGLTGGSGVASSSDIFQLVDLTALQQAASGQDIEYALSARFNRVAGNANTDTQFILEASFFNGDPADFGSLTALDAHSGNLSSDGDLQSWQRISVLNGVPTQASFGAIRISAVEDVSNGPDGDEFDGHYVDDVRLIFNIDRQNLQGSVSDGANTVPFDFDVDVDPNGAFCNIEPAGLISWYPADGSGDDIVTGNDMALNGNPAFGPLQTNEAFLFDGIDDFARVSNPQRLPVGAEPRTMMIWFRTPVDLTANPDTGIMQYGSDSNSQLFALLTSANNPGKLTFSGFFDDMASSTTLLPNTLYHAAVTYDGSELILYLDGQPEDSRTTTLNTVVDQRGLQIGLRDGLIGTHFWDGELDEAMIFDRALSQQEIDEIFRANSVGVCKSMACTPLPSDAVAWYPGEGDGNDVAGFANGLTEGGTDFRSGRVGAGFEFDGVDGRVRVAENGQNPFSKAITVASWIRIDGFPDGSPALVTNRTNGTTFGFTLSIQSGDQRLAFEIEDDSGNSFFVNSNSSLPVGELVHVAASFSGGIVNLFINGQLDRSVSAGVSAVGLGDDLLLGGGAFGGASFDGLMDEVQLYSRALHPTEVRRLVESGGFGQCRVAQIIEEMRVLTTNPTSNQSNVSREPTIQASFNRDLDDSNLSDPGAIVVHSALQGRDQPLSVAPELNNGLAYSPNFNAFEAGERISVSLTSNLRSLDGAQLKPHVFEFTTVVAGPGRANFIDGTPGFIQQRHGSTAAADFNGDRINDLLIGYGLYLGDNSGNFGNPVDLQGLFAFASELNNRLHAVDLDNDGDVDIVDLFDHRIQVILNDGNANFTALPVQEFREQSTFNISGSAVGDFDGDGDIDIVWTSSSGSNDGEIFLNDGTGVFESHPVQRRFLVGTQLLNIQAADLDNDGDLDLVSSNGAASSPKRSRVILNDGTGVFTAFGELGFELGGLLSTNIALGDVDGDGDIDAVRVHSESRTGVGSFNSLTQNSVWLNDGQANFSFHPDQGFGANAARTARLGDLDSDGDLDLLIGTGDRFGDNNDDMPNERDEVYLNDGTGSFTEINVGIGSNLKNNTTGPLLVDLDGDRDLDVVTNFTGGFGGSGSFAVFLNVDDADGDGLDAAQEDQLGTDPNNADTDGDGFSDFDEVNQDGNPNDFNPNGGDTDPQNVNDFPGAGEVVLSALDGTNGFRMDGDQDATQNSTSGGDRVGPFAASAGDVNGDGFEDIIIGANANDTFDGEAYVVFGRASGFPATLALASLATGGGTDGFVLRGNINDQVGTGVTRLGDLNGDGFDDLIVGAPDQDDNGFNTGTTYIVFGRASFPQVYGILGKPANEVLQLRGSDINALSGDEISGDGDINGDGIPDIVIGGLNAFESSTTNSQARGRAYILFGGESLNNLDNPDPAQRDGIIELSGINGSNGFFVTGTDFGDRIGNTVGIMGDVNGDGFDDVLVGAPHDTRTSVPGEAYLIFGRDTGYPQTFDHEALRTGGGAEGCFIEGEAAGDLFSTLITRVGDVDGDRFDDLLIAAGRSNFNGNSSGRAYLIRGGSDICPSGVISVANLTAPDGFKIDGERAGDLLGDLAVGEDGIDFNADGLGELIFGARGFDADVNNPTADGRSYLLYGNGPSPVFPTNASGIDANNGLVFDGVTTGEQLNNIRGGGDINGDGLQDLLMGAFLRNNGRGALYAVFGFDARNEIDFLGADADDNLLGNNSENRLVGGRGDDTLDGLGANDILLGGLGNDLLIFELADTRLVDGGRGQDTLRVLSNVSLVIDQNQAGHFKVIRNVELIELGFNSDLSISSLGVIKTTDRRNVLRVQPGASASDTSVASSDVWDLGPVINVAGTNFQQYLNGNAILEVAEGVDQTGIPVSRFERFSLSSEGVQANQASELGDVSGGGCCAVFDSTSTNLVVSPATGGFSQIYLRDPDNNTTQLISQAGGVAGNSNSENPVVDASGDLVVFESVATNLLSVGSGSRRRIFAYRRSTDTFQLVSADSQGTDANADSRNPAITADGQFVVFETQANNLDPAVTGFGVRHLYRKNLNSGELILVSRNTAGDPANGSSFDPSISVDGSTVAFVSQATNLVAGDNNSQQDVFVKDLDGNTLVAASSDAAGNFGTGGFSFDPVIRGDASSVVFSSNAVGLVSGDTNADRDLFLKQLDGSNAIERINLNPNGNLEATVGDFDYSGDGRFVSFAAENPSNGVNTRLFVRDLLNQQSFDLSLTDRQQLFNGVIERIKMSFDGKNIGFDTAANNVVESVDSNGGLRDVYGFSNPLFVDDPAADFDSDGLTNSQEESLGTNPFSADSDQDGATDFEEVNVDGNPNNFDPQAGDTDPSDPNSRPPLAELRLQNLDGQNGVRMFGAATGDQAGDAVGPVGDIDNDGFDDVIVGAHLVDVVGTNSGQAYLYYGNSTGHPAQIDLVTFDGNNGAIFSGAASEDRAGTAVHGSGDFNGDGIADLIISARGADPSGLNAAGTVYVVYGDNGVRLSSPFDLGTIDGTNGSRLNGATNGEFVGESIASIGDFNGDGLSDLVIGAPSFGAQGRTHIVFGQQGGFGADFDLGSLDGNNGIIANASDPNTLNSGTVVSSAGDINGDGLDDVVIGAPISDSSTGDSSVGQAFVLFGTANPAAATVDLNALDGTDGFTLRGVNVGDQLGLGVGGAGDFNGDGVGDLIVGAPLADPAGRLNAGQAYLIFGKKAGFSAELDVSLLNGSDGIRINGGSPSDVAGIAVAGNRDFNGDGRADLLIGATGADDPGLSRIGFTYIVYGVNGPFSADFELSALTPQQGLIVKGVNAFDDSGQAVSSAGDVNGDGFDDLLIGALQSDIKGTNAGEAYLVFGNDFRSEIDRLGTPGDDNLAGGPEDNHLVGGLGNDILTGGNGNDSQLGGAGDDNIVLDLADRRLNDGGSGNDLLTVAASIQFNLDNINENLGGGFQRYRNFEVLQMLSSSGFTANGDDIRKLTDLRNTLRVDGDASNAVASTEAWLIGDIVNINGQDYQEYKDDGALMQVDTDIDQSGIQIAVEMTRLSETAAGAEGNGGSQFPTVSADERFVAFTSLATNLHSNALASQPDGIETQVLVNNQGIDPHVITLESTVPSGANDVPVSLSVNTPTINADGSLIVGITSSSEISPSNGNAQVVLFNLRDRSATVLSTDGAGNAGDGESQTPTFSGDGQFVVFRSQADNLVSGVTSTNFLIYRVNLQTNVIELVSADDTGVIADSDSSQPRCNFDCSQVVFSSFGTNLGSPSSSRAHIYAKNMNTGVVERISQSQSGAVGNRGSSNSAISGDGNLVAFISTAFNLIDGFDDRTGTNIFLKNRSTGVVTKVDTDASGDINRANPGIVVAPIELSADGRFVVFLSTSTTLVPGTQGSTVPNVYVKRLSDNAILRATNGADGQGLNNRDVALSADGRLVGFSSNFSDLVSNDNNGLFDIFGFENPLHTDNVGFDLDGDGLDHPTELGLGTNPALSDTDGDGSSDFDEVNVDGNPNNFDPGSGDTDPNNSANHPARAQFRLADLNGSNGLTLNGAVASDSAGTAVGPAGDFDQDGFADVLVGAPTFDGVGTDSGAAYLFYGESSHFASTDLITLDGINGAIFGAPAAGDRLGFSVHGSGDFNGDGVSDVLVSALFADDPVGSAGAVFVVYGSDTTPLTSPFDLATIDGVTASRLNGAGSNERAGSSITSIGDFNGDGLSDIAISAPNFATTTGRVFVLFGQDGGFGTTFDLSSVDGSNGFIVLADFANINLGFKLASAGDVNGDGLDDLLVSSHLSDTGGLGNNGQAHLIFGTATPPASFNINSIDGVNGFSVNGASSNDELGNGVGTAGDFNGDGFADIILGAENVDSQGRTNNGEAYLIFGKATGFSADIDVGLLDGNNGFRFNGANGGDSLGLSVTGGQDFNGDGRDDLLLGARGADDQGKSSTGFAYLIYGADGPFTADFDLNTLNAQDGLVMVGIDAFDGIGGDGLSGVADFNGDGIADFMIGAALADPNGSASGEAYVVFGDGFLGDIDFRGSTGDDVIVGDGLNNHLIGGLGNDSLDGGIGNDSMAGGAGNDEITLDLNDLLHVDGGTGEDRLLVPSGVGFNLPDVNANQGGRFQRYRNFEVIALGSTASFVANGIDVRKITDLRNTLRVDGDSTNSAAADEAWELGLVVTIDGNDYQEYLSEGATMQVDADIDRSAIPLTSNARMASRHSDGVAQGDQDALSMEISGDGRFVVFQSNAFNLVDTPTQGVRVRQIYRHDRQTGDTIMVSEDGGVAGDDDSGNACVNSNGNLIAFETRATNLVDGVTANQFVLKDQTAGTYSIISTGPQGNFNTTISGECEFSANDQFIVFDGIPLGSGVAPNTSRRHVFRHTISTGVNDAASFDGTTEHCDNGKVCDKGSISGDGRFVVFAAGEDILAGDNNGLHDIVLRDMSNTTYELITSGANDISVRPSISNDGDLIVFESRAGNLVPGDNQATGGPVDMFLFQRSTGDMYRINTDSAGNTPGDSRITTVTSTGRDGQGDPEIDGSGNFVVWTSNQDITNQAQNSISAYVKQITLPGGGGEMPGEVFRFHINPEGAFYNGTQAADGVEISRDGSVVGFETRSNNVDVPDTNARQDVFAADNPLSP